MSGNAEWDRLWQIVHATPEDFSSWEQLIRVAESVEITSTSPPEHITNLELVYDAFLSKFPLCFGYWKKYADWEGIARGSQEAERVSTN
jgi:pre-mRNA-processing factor 39